MEAAGSAGSGMAGGAGVRTGAQAHSARDAATTMIAHERDFMRQPSARRTSAP